MKRANTSLLMLFDRAKVLGSYGARTKFKNTEEKHPLPDASCLEQIRKHFPPRGPCGRNHKSNCQEHG